jgi:hypothetical protein
MQKVTRFDFAAYTSSLETTVGNDRGNLSNWR